MEENNNGNFYLCCWKCWPGIPGSSCIVRKTGTSVLNWRHLFAVCLAPSLSLAALLLLCSIWLWCMRFFVVCFLLFKAVFLVCKVKTFLVLNSAGNSQDPCCCFFALWPSWGNFTSLSVPETQGWRVMFYGNVWVENWTAHQVGCSLVCTGVFFFCLIAS